jgi:hypothetical protein
MIDGLTYDDVRTVGFCPVCRCQYLEFVLDATGEYLECMECDFKIQNLRVDESSDWGKGDPWEGEPDDDEVEEDLCS